MQRRGCQVFFFQNRYTNFQIFRITKLLINIGTGVVAAVVRRVVVRPIIVSAVLEWTGSIHRDFSCLDNFRDLAQ